MIKLNWKQGDNKLGILLPSDDYIEIPVSCDVRNLSNQRRAKNEVVRTIPDNKPYNPQIFPVGKWSIGMPLKRGDKYKAPYFIPTNAEQKVHVWALDADGNYDHKTKKTVIDKAYGLHFSTSKTTLGCIKICNEKDLLFLANILFAELRFHEVCILEVTA